MSIYNTALSEFLESDENDRHKLIYAYFGLAVYFSQCIEETLSILLWTDRVSARNIKTSKEINEIIDSFENSKKTMGNFIHEVNKTYNLSKDVEKDLFSILKIRNHLVHKYFKQEIQKFYSETGQKEMLQYFCAFIDKSQKLDSVLNEYHSKYTNHLGLTEERISEIMEEMKLEEIQRVNRIS